MAMRRIEAEGESPSKPDSSTTQSPSQKSEYFGWVVRDALRRNKQTLDPIVGIIEQVLLGRKERIINPSPIPKPIGGVFYVNESGVHPYQEFPTQPKVPKRQTENAKHSVSENVDFRSGRRQRQNHRGFRNGSTKET